MQELYNKLNERIEEREAKINKNLESEKWTNALYEENLKLLAQQYEDLEIMRMIRERNFR